MKKVKVILMSLLFSAGMVLPSVAQEGFKEALPPSKQELVKENRNPVLQNLPSRSLRILSKAALRDMKEMPGKPLLNKESAQPLLKDGATVYFILRRRIRLQEDFP